MLQKQLQIAVLHTNWTTVFRYFRLVFLRVMLMQLRGYFVRMRKNNYLPCYKKKQQ